MNNVLRLIKLSASIAAISISSIIAFIIVEYSYRQINQFKFTSLAAAEPCAENFENRLMQSQSINQHHMNMKIAINNEDD